MATSVESILIEINKLDELIMTSSNDSKKELIKQRNDLSKQLQETNSLLHDRSKVLKG